MEIYLDRNTQAFIRYFDFPGDAPAVVYLAGLGLASTAIYPRVVVETGLSDWRSILVDLFGCSYSDRPEHFNYSIEEHASTLSGFLDHIGARQYILVGHSLGGAIAIELAAKRPNLVVQLILAEANIDAGGGSWSRKIADQSESDFMRIGYAESIANQHSAALAADTASAVALGMWHVASPLGIYRSAVSVVKGT